jgi:hypothetical protein
VGLFRLYQYCLDCIRQGDYASALSALRELREAWAQTEKKMSPAAKPVQVQQFSHVSV